MDIAHGTRARLLLRHAKAPRDLAHSPSVTSAKFADLPKTNPCIESNFVLLESESKPVAAAIDAIDEVVAEAEVRCDKEAPIVINRLQPLGMHTCRGAE